MRSDDSIRPSQAARLSVVPMLALLTPSAHSAAQSYGLGDQVLTLGAAEFHSARSTDPVSTNFTDGYLYGLASYIAPLRLPDGSEIFQMCIYAYVSVPNTSANAVIVSNKLVPGGQTPFLGGIADSFVSDEIPIGYGTVCTDPFSYVFHDFEDIDGDGSPDPVAHFVEAGGGEGFGGVRIFWHRRVSPPPGTPTFNDVPADDPNFEYVEALVASGITSGCGTNPPRYCPDAPLTLRQMAVFLAKALGLHWAN